MLIQYIGNSCLTIQNGDIMELVAIKRLSTKPNYSKYIYYFKSGIILAFRTESGNIFGWSDRNDWIKTRISKS